MEKPVVHAWAVMRNFHEALRMSLKEQTEVVALYEIAHARSLFASMYRAVTEHAHMEDSVAFSLLAQYGPLSVDKFTKQHVEHERLSNLVTSADNGSYPQRFKDYKTYALDHLKEEEDEMTALTLKTGSTPQERAARFAKEVLSQRTPDFDFLVSWTVDHLSRMGSTGQDANTATRVFCAALRVASLPEQWKHWAGVIQKHCMPAVWESMVNSIDIASTNDCLQA